MAKSEIASAIKQICEEKNIPYESVIDTINQALAAAFRKDFGEKNQNIKSEFDPETGKTRVFDVKTVVEDLTEEELEELSGKRELGDKEGKKDSPRSEAVGDPEPSRGETPVATGANTPTKKDEAAKKEKPKEKKEDKETDNKKAAENAEEEKPKFNPRTDLQISDAKKIKKTAKVGTEIKTRLEIPDEFGRMAAQTAKQVIIQRLREAERDVLYKEFKNKEGEVLTGIIQRREGRLVLIDLGATTAIIPPDQQIETENYNSGQRYRVYISEVRETSKGPEIIASRTHPEIVKQLFSVEVPEIASDTVEIKALSREAGSRSKVAVHTDDESIDPIGSCVGQRGTRIQTIITELGGEKLDIIHYDDDPTKFIANALSPAKVVAVEVNEEEKIAKVKVKPDQLSLAIGKAGQNVRLAAKLTGWKIDIEEIAAPGEKPKDKEKKEDKKEEPDKEVKQEKENKKSDDKKDEKSKDDSEEKEDKKDKEKPKKEDDKKEDDKSEEKEEGKKKEKDEKDKK